VDAAIGSTNDQRGLEPGLFAHGFRQIVPGHHEKEADERRLSFFENHRPAANAAELGTLSRPFNSLTLLFRKDTREYTARCEMSRGDPRVVRDVAA
jgi:hypothetical protein